MEKICNNWFGPKNEFLKISTLLFNPLSANVVYTPHDGDVTCSRCSPRTGKSIKNGFATKWYTTLYLSEANHQKSCYES